MEEKLKEQTTNLPTDNNPQNTQRLFSKREKPCYSLFKRVNEKEKRVKLSVESLVNIRGLNNDSSSLNPEGKIAKDQKWLKIYNNIKDILVIPSNRRQVFTLYKKEDKESKTPSKCFKETLAKGKQGLALKGQKVVGGGVVEEWDRENSIKITNNQQKATPQLKLDKTGIEHKSLKINQDRETLFLNMKALMKKHFLGKGITIEDIDLTQKGLRLLLAILKRKYKNKEDIKESSIIEDNNPDNALLSLLLKLKAKKSTKRPEENYKFVFKRCIKHLQDKLKKTLKTKLKKKEFDKYFHQYYFEQIAFKEGLTLEHFYHPRNSKKRYSNAPKTINHEYIRNISHNSKFIAEFSSYMRRGLFEDYSKTIDNKINGLICKWGNQLKSAEDYESTFNMIVVYIETNIKCKLPWSRLEVEEAIDFTDKLFI